MSWLLSSTHFDHGVVGAHGEGVSSLRCTQEAENDGKWPSLIYPLSSPLILSPARSQFPKFLQLLSNVPSGEDFSPHVGAGRGHTFHI